MTRELKMTGREIEDNEKKEILLMSKLITDFSCAVFNEKAIDIALMALNLATIKIIFLLLSEGPKQNFQENLDLSIEHFCNGLKKCKETIHEMKDLEKEDADLPRHP